jgi:hypothetical protein
MADNRVPLSPYLFYEFLSYPLPFEREFFAYDMYMYATHMHRALAQDQGVEAGIPWDHHLSASDSVLDILRQDIFSWVNVSNYVMDALCVIPYIQRFFPFLPFIEAVYLVGPITCNAPDAERELKFWVVSDVGRVWFVAVILRCVRWLWHIWSRFQPVSKHPPFRISWSMIFDRTRAHLTPVKTSRHDVTFVYNMAHAVPVYFCSQDQPFPLYEYNRWIKDYLPNFPCRHVISLWINIVFGRNIIARLWTSLLSWWLWDGVEALLRGLGKISMLVRTVLWKTSYWKHGIMHPHIIIIPDLTRKKIALKRKVFKSYLVRHWW